MTPNMEMFIILLLGMVIFGLAFAMTDFYIGFLTAGIGGAILGVVAEKWESEQDD